jgi:hypothetical protein
MPVDLQDFYWTTDADGDEVQFLYLNGDLVALVRRWPVIAPDARRWSYMICRERNLHYFPTEREAKTALLAALKEERNG